ncbi:hypothetical protein VNO80_01336 [Phaseolus coccineus]|uniref:Uncharacterized protein n=1 Tax=Phaseolus coccineus TaxID=3886 RepID=A0AAN9WWF7_PHACN
MFDVERGKFVAFQSVLSCCSYAYFLTERNNAEELFFSAACRQVGSTFKDVGKILSISNYEMIKGCMVKLFCSSDFMGFYA